MKIRTVIFVAAIAVILVYGYNIWAQSGFTGESISKELNKVSEVAQETGAAVSAVGEKLASYSITDFKVTPERTYAAFDFYVKDVSGAEKNTACTVKLKSKGVDEKTWSLPSNVHQVKRIGGLMPATEYNYGIACGSASKSGVFKTKG